MSSVKKILLLNGSSRKKGTSFSFARTMKIIAEESGNTAEIVHAIDYFDGKKDLNHLADLISNSDAIAMIAPLYSDTLPYFDIWLLERLAKDYGNVLRGKSFFALGQCGFPDITRNGPLIDACRFFAEDTDMKWLGGLSYGGGPMINGALLENLGKKGEKITAGFRLAIGNILSGEIIPSKAQHMITFDVPKILYWPLVVFLNNIIKKKARENGNADFRRKVYLE
ncbi:MAG: NAD(P)H-dependent oxidoreductase [Bacillota bacterium]